jgi:hypothetical protein
MRLKKLARNSSGKKLAEAEQTRTDVVTGLLQQLTQAEAAQKSAEEIRAKTQGEMNELRTNSTARRNQ